MDRFGHVGRGVARAAAAEAGGAAGAVPQQAPVLRSARAHTRFSVRTMAIAGVGFGRRWRQTLLLAWRDAVHEWPVSLCMILALAAVLAPLLVLFGLKSGIVTTMRERLRSDPRTVEISPRGHYRLDAAWFDALRARSGGAVPASRGPGRCPPPCRWRRRQGRRSLDVDMLPTAAGDPLLPAGSARRRGPCRASCSPATAAAKLGVGSERPADRRGRPADGRQRRGGSCAADRCRHSSGSELSPATPSFVSLPLSGRDGGLPRRLRRPGARRDEAAPRRATGRRAAFASFRLYARDIDDVAPLAPALARAGP